MKALDMILLAMVGTVGFCFGFLAGETRIPEPTTEVITISPESELKDCREKGGDAFWMNWYGDDEVNITCDYRQGERKTINVNEL